MWLFFSFVVSQRNSSCFQRRFPEFPAFQTRTTLSSGTYQNVAKKFKLPGHPRLKAMAKYSCVEHFLKVYQAKDVTPYMHALCYANLIFRGPQNQYSKCHCQEAGTGGSIFAVDSFGWKIKFLSDDEDVPNVIFQLHLALQFLSSVPY